MQDVIHVTDQRSTDMERRAKRTLAVSTPAIVACRTAYCIVSATDKWYDFTTTRAICKGQIRHREVNQQLGSAHGWLLTVVSSLTGEVCCGTGHEGGEARRQRDQTDWGHGCWLLRAACSG